MKLIVAVDEENGIAKNGTIPWSCKEDLSFFRFITYGNTIIMGNNTFKSIGLKPLSGRKNIVITGDISKYSQYQSNPNHGFNNYVEFSGPSIIFKNPSSSFIIGGLSIYNLALSTGLVDTMYVSYINGKYDCDMFFDPVTSIKSRTTLRLSPKCTVVKYILYKK